MKASHGVPFLFLMKKDIYIVVMQRHDLRVNLEKQITEDSIAIMIIIYPFLGLLIWVIVGKGLRSIAETANEIKERDEIASPHCIRSSTTRNSAIDPELNRLIVGRLLSRKTFCSRRRT